MKLTRTARIVEGSFDSQEFYDRSASTYDPYPEERSVLVVDNCRIHHNEALVDLIKWILILAVTAFGRRGYVVHSQRKANTVIYKVFKHSAAIHRSLCSMSQSKELGTLVVVVLKARHLHQPSFYKQDPYAQVALSGQTQKTKPDPKGGQHPVWDDEFRFPVLADPGKDQVNRKLEVSCWKDEPRSEDKLLGKGVIDIESTLKTGEFDDWVQLETSGGARGELYLEMTFYANAPPPLNRRATKLTPSDRLARPQSYHPGPLKSGAAYLSPDASPPPPGRSLNPTPVQLSDPGYVAPAAPPTSLLPARGQPPSWAQPKTPPSKSPSPSPHRQSPQNKTDTLPPLPEEVEAPRKPGHLPTILRPGGRPIPLAGRYGTPTWNHDSISDAPVYMSPPTPMSLLQTPVQERPLEISELLGVCAPLIVADQPMDEHCQSSLSIAAPHTTEPQFYHEPGQGQSNYYLLSNAAPQQYPPPSQGYVPPQTFSPPPQSYQQPYTPQNYAPPPPNPQQSLPPLHAHQYQVHQPPSLIPPYQPPSTPYPHSYSPNLFSHPPPPPAPQSYTTFTPSPSPYPPPQPQGYAQQPQTYTPAPPQQQAYQQPSYFHPPPPSQTPVLPPQTQPSPTPSPSYFSPPPPPPPLPGCQKGTPAARGETQSPQIQGHQNVAPTAPPALGLDTTSTSPSQPSPAEVPLASSVPPIVSEDQRKREEDQSIKAVEDEEQRRKDEGRKAAEEADLRRREEEEAQRRAADEERRRQEEEEQKMKEVEEQKRREEERLKCEAERRQKEEEERRQREEEGRRRVEEERRRREEEERRRVEEEQRQAEEARLKREEEERRRLEEERRKLEEEARLTLEEERVRREEEARRKGEEERRRQKAEEDKARRKRAEEAEAERRWQIELARIKARAEQEASDAAFARAQFEAEEAERRRQEEEDLAFARRAHEEAEREIRAAEERRRQEELDRELARREQAHEEELERKREEERRRQVEETDREMARKLDMELNLGPGDTTSSPELPARRRGG